jgi:bifunctional N-acetylglucosamine-1-phosphate-uridyltransferase/glucosamine-1-phosphate-acetyltransferase GlmU-like protein
MKYLSSALFKIVFRNRQINKKIPTMYLLRFSVAKFIELIYGIVVFGTLKPVYVCPSATIKCKRNIRFGKNLRIAKFAHIDALSYNGISLGNEVSIGMYTVIVCTGSMFEDLGVGFKVGDRVGVGSHGIWGCKGGIEIGDDTIIGNYVTAHSENHNFDDKNIPIRDQGVNNKGIIIGKGCWIGAKSTILDGAVIGDGCVVAAGSVVRGEFPPFSIIGGVPARILKMRE